MVVLVVSTSETLYWPFIVDLGLLFVVFAVSISATIFFGIRYNQNLVRIEEMISRAAVIKMRARTSAESPTPIQQFDDPQDDDSERFLALSQEVANNLKLHHAQHRAEFLFMHASPELGNTIYAYISFLAASIFSALVAAGWIPLGGLVAGDR